MSQEPYIVVAVENPAFTVSIIDDTINTTHAIIVINAKILINVFILDSF